MKRDKIYFHTSVNIMRITLLFGSLAMAMGLIMLPLMAQKSDKGELQTVFKTQLMSQRDNESNVIKSNFSSSLIPQIPTSSNYR